MPPPLLLRQYNPRILTLIHHLLTTATGRTLLVFTLLYLLLIQHCRQTFYRDPTSFFFDPHRGYERIYSGHRQRQAESFIQNANFSFKNASIPLNQNPTMCIGIATVERSGDQYVPRTMGSLLDGLTEEERRQIHTIVLIAHTDPHRHPSYAEPWLHNLASRILLYDTADMKQLEQLKEMEKDKDYRRKAIFDYTYLMKTCIDSGASWVAMIEDDTLAVSGWYPRTIKALDDADAKSAAWLYLRLFFTEEFFGWNSEYWPQYLLSSFLIVAMVGGILLLLRQVQHLVPLANGTILTLTFLCTPACILLYFMAGRLSMRPMDPGVREMPNFGCCAQGLVFSLTSAAQALAKLNEKGFGFVDMILEEWANEERLTRFATIPSLLQHIGGHSSKGDDIGVGQPLSVAERIFSFGFELYSQQGSHVIHPSDNR
ncbi:MAG: hypothetical protein Q9222_002267 [Ikaeria aurantiellina]